MENALAIVGDSMNCKHRKCFIFGAPFILESMQSTALLSLQDRVGLGKPLCIDGIDANIDAN